jgi:hypothetical protein
MVKFESFIRFSPFLVVATCQTHQSVGVSQPHGVIQRSHHEASVVYTTAQTASAPVSSDIVHQPMCPPESSQLPPSYNEAVNQEYQQQPLYNPNFPINEPHQGH